MPKLTTTIKALWDAGASKSLIDRLGKVIPVVTDDDPITLLQILDTNGLEDAIWCLWMWPEYDREWRLLACDYAEMVSHLWTHPASAIAVETSRRYANGQCGVEELNAAHAGANVVEGAAWSAATCNGTCEENHCAYYAALNAASAAAGVAARVAATAAGWALDADMRQKQADMLRAVTREIERNEQ